MVVALDITERKKVEETLRYHAQLVDSVSDAIISTDTNFRITSWNQAAERIYGWKAEEVIGKDGSDVLVIRAEPPDNRCEIMLSTTGLILPR